MSLAVRQEVAACGWCGAEVESANAGTADAVFCCPGCETASTLVHGAGLDAYFARRDTMPPRPEGQGRRDWAQIPRSETPDGQVEATFHVDGLRCAACTWLSERVMLDLPGVTEAQVSYGTGAARLRFDPNVASLDEALRRVSLLGYRPRAVDAAPTDDRELLNRLGVASFAAGNVMMLAVAVYLGWFSGMHEAYQGLFRWFSLLLATPVTFYSAAPFFQGAIQGLRHRVLHMDLPIALAVAGVYAHGLYATVVGGEGWLDSLTMLVALLLVGKVLEQRGRRRAAEAAQALAVQAPSSARRITPMGLEVVPASALRIGDRFELGAGEEIAADGRVVEGHGRVQMGLLTGESEAVAVGPGRSVVAGAVLAEGHLRVEVVAPAAESMLARMAELLRDAASRPPEPTAADRLAPWFVGLTLVASAVSFAVWSTLTGPAHALEVTVAVLVVACPCALALAAPLAAHAGLGAAARRGLLLRGGDAVRRTAEVDLVALDKTGTLTFGQPRVVTAEDRVLRIAAGIERASVHPIARAIVDEAGARGIPLPLGERILETPGQGIEGVVDGRLWRVQSGGAGVVEVREEGGALLGRIHLRDRLREEAVAAVASLRRLGVSVVLLTGDHEQVAREIGQQVGIDEVLAARSPEEKAAWIAARRAEGRRVLFVGDGVNDGPALAEADVGIAMGHGAASSVMVADGILVHERIDALRAGLLAARAAARVGRISVWRSVIYNVATVTLAMFGLVNPLVAAVLMPLSSGLVVAGAMSVEGRVARGSAT